MRMLNSHYEAKGQKCVMSSVQCELFKGYGKVLDCCLRWMKRMTPHILPPHRAFMYS